MTKKENEACKVLCEEALKKIEQAEGEYAKAGLLKRDGGDFETQMRKADRHFGEAEGIYNALVKFNFRSAKMKLLVERL